MLIVIGLPGKTSEYPLIKRLETDDLNEALRWVYERGNDIVAVLKENGEVAFPEPGGYTNGDDLPHPIRLSPGMIDVILGRSSDPFL